MKDAASKKFESLNADLLNRYISAIGVILCLVGIVLPGEIRGHDTAPYFTIFISVGCSLLATSLVSILSSRYLIRRQRIRQIIETWGLVEIFESRQRMNDPCGEAQDNAKNQVDIIAMGLKSWRDGRGDKITALLKRNVAIRILAPHPDLPAVEQRTKDEGETEGQIRHSLEQLEAWVQSMRQYGSIELKFYHALPEDFYFRIDDALFIGPYLYGKGSQQTISYQYKKPGKAFEMYTRYFEKLWNNEDNFLEE